MRADEGATIHQFSDRAGGLDLRRTVHRCLDLRASDPLTRQQDEVTLLDGERLESGLSP
jgi:hypothetical protein